MPTPFFADLVRELCQEGGTGPLTPAGAVPGHRRFADSVPVDTPFHYAVAGIARTDQWEIGSGRIDGDGRLARDTVAASSSGGGPVDFAPGLKTLALTVGAGWYSASDAAVLAVTAGLDAKQPLSTSHAAVANAAAGDLLTVRRGDHWVNVPLSEIAFRSAEGRFDLTSPIGASAGTAATPSIGFAEDPDTGLFRAAADALGIGTGGIERLRVHGSGNVGIGLTGAALQRLVVCSPASDSLADIAQFRVNNIAGNDGHGLVVGADAIQNLVQFKSTGTQTGGFIFHNGAVERLRLDVNGHLRPGADNAQAMGAAAARWTVLYAGTGTINTSDAREKQWRGAASAAELRAAGRIIGELGFFQWNDAIAEKGPDGARYHFGVRAQAVWAIMAGEGLIDPLDADGRPGTTPYAFLCWDAWPADAGTEMRFGVRPDQLALFLIAAQEARIAALEAAT